MSLEVVVRYRLACEATELAYLRVHEALTEAMKVSNDPHIPALAAAKTRLRQAWELLPARNLYG